MIPATTIHTALVRDLQATGLLDRVERAAQDDLTAALAGLRDSSETVAILIPTGEELDHQLLPDDNTPLRSEIKTRMSLLVTGENPARASNAGDDLPLKDLLLTRLLWADLSIPGLILLPLSTEPVRLEFDGGAARDAWRIDLEAREILLTQ